LKRSQIQIQGFNYLDLDLELNINTCIIILLNLYLNDVYEYVAAITIIIVAAILQILLKSMIRIYTCTLSCYFRYHFIVYLANLITFTTCGSVEYHKQ
jgi:hypothetical protein